MTKLNTKRVALLDLERRIKKDLNSKDLPIKDRVFKEFLHEQLKSYRLTKTEEGISINTPEEQYFNILYKSSPGFVGNFIGTALKYIEELNKGKRINTITDKKGEIYKITLT